MGTVGGKLESEDNIEFHLNSIKIAQEFLMTLFQLNTGPKSSEAIKILTRSFQDALVKIKDLQTASTGDLDLDERNLISNRRRAAEILLQSMENFKVYLTPEYASQNVKIKSEINRLIEIQKELESIASKIVEQTPLTPEAKELKGPKIKGTYQ
jgi:hypothetical protein